MKRPVQLHFECVWLALAFLLVPGNPIQAADSATAFKPVLLYSRYFNAEGEARYLPDGTFKDVLQRLRQDFEVRIHNKPPTSETLADVKLVLIANPGDQAVGTDAGWITDSTLSGQGVGAVAIKDQDNWEIFRRLAEWVAGVSKDSNQSSR